MPNPVIDAFSSLLGGMHEGIDPMILREDQYARGVNISSRGGLIRNRPALDEIISLSNIKDFKGAGVYSFPDGNEETDRVVYADGNTIYVVNLDTLTTVTHKTTLNVLSKRFFFAQIGKYFVIQDGYPNDTWELSEWPVILDKDGLYDQGSLRDSFPEHAFPKGAAMAFGQGRAFVSLDWAYDFTRPEGDTPTEVAANTANWKRIDRESFYAGDINQSWDATAVLSFTENNAFDGGGAISIPNHHGTITAMAFQQNVGSGTGHGPLVVFAEHGSSSFAVDLPRVGATDDSPDWFNSQFGKVLFDSGGMVATNSVAHVNNDILYRSRDGIRTLRYSANQAQAQGLGLSNDPISNEVDNLLESNISDQSFCSAAFAKNRYAVLANKGTEDWSWNGAVILDTSQISVLTTSSTPVYDGIWTGLDFFHVLSAKRNDKESLVFIGNDRNGDSGIYELNDSVLDKRSLRQKCRVYTRYLHFNSTFFMKTLQHVNLWLDEIYGNFEISVYYRADGLSLWKEAGSARIKGDNNKSGRARSIRIYPSETECSADNQPGDAHAFFSCQFCIEFKGRGKITKAQFVALPLTQDIYFDACEGDIDVSLDDAMSSNFLNLNDFDYKI